MLVLAVVGCCWLSRCSHGHCHANPRFAFKSSRSTASRMRGSNPSSNRAPTTHDQRVEAERPSKKGTPRCPFLCMLSHAPGMAHATTTTFTDTSIRPSTPPQAVSAYDQGPSHNVSVLVGAAFNVAVWKHPSRIHPPRGLPGGLRGWPRPPSFGHGECRLPQTAC